MILAMATFIMGGNVLRMKLDFIFVRFVSLKSDIIKVNKGSDKFRK